MTDSRTTALLLFGLLVGTLSAASGGKAPPQKPAKGSGEVKMPSVAELKQMLGAKGWRCASPLAEVPDIPVIATWKEGKRVALSKGAVLRWGWVVARPPTDVPAGKPFKIALRITWGSRTAREFEGPNGRRVRYDWYDEPWRWTTSTDKEATMRLSSDPKPYPRKFVHMQEMVELVEGCRVIGRWYENGTGTIEFIKNGPAGKASNKGQGP